MKREVRRLKTGSALTRQDGEVSRVYVTDWARFVILATGGGNLSVGVCGRDPEGGPESRLWVAGAGRGHGARTARPTENTRRHLNWRREVTSGDNTE